MVMTSEPAAIGIRRLRLRRGEFELGISQLRVKSGELAVLIGRNGAGKSTLLEGVNGQIESGTGQIQIFGSSLIGMAGRRRAQLLAAIPQEFEIPFSYRVKEVVDFGRAPHIGFLGRMGPGDHRAVSAALAECDLAHLAHRPLGELSGGQRRRVALAVALAQDTPILLADEPSAHMDIGRIAWCWQLLLERARAGRAVLAAAHDLNIAAAFADRIYLLGEGRLLAGGDPAAVISQSNLESGFGISARVELSAGRPRVAHLSPHPADSSDSASDPTA